MKLKKEHIDILNHCQSTEQPFCGKSPPEVILMRWERQFYPGNDGEPTSIGYKSIAEAHDKLMQDMFTDSDPFVGIRSILALLDLQWMVEETIEVSVPYGTVIWTYSG